MASATQTHIQMSEELAKRLHPKQRLSPEDIHARGYVHYNVEKASAGPPSVDYRDDAQLTFLDRMKMEKQKFVKNLERAHRRRPSMEMLEQRGIVPSGYDVFCGFFLVGVIGEVIVVWRE